MVMDYSYLSVEKTSTRLGEASRSRTGCHLIKMSCKNTDSGGKENQEDSVNCTDDLIVLRVTVDNRAVCNFSYSTDGKEFTAIGRPFTARAGKWIGAKVGLFCLAQPGESKPGYTEFDWFRFE